VPESARGEAIGRSTAAFTLGNAMGAPLAGFVIDQSSPAFGFVAVGAVGAALALAAMGAGTLRRDRPGRLRPSESGRVALSGGTTSG